MFESSERLSGEIAQLLDAIRGLAGARYACLVEPKGIVFESAEPSEPEAWALRRYLTERANALFSIPQRLATGEPMDDVFEGWDQDEFFLAFINGRIALLVACPEAELLRERTPDLLKALADRLFRYNETYRLDPQGGGFFMGQAKLDIVVVERAQD